MPDIYLGGGLQSIQTPRHLDTSTGCGTPLVLYPWVLAIQTFDFDAIHRLASVNQNTQMDCRGRVGLDN